MNTSMLYRSRRDRMLAGVCGGLGQYLGMDATLVRLFFVLFTLANGAGFLLYLVLMILMPASPEDEDGELEPMTPFWDNPKAIRLAGVTLVAVGVFLFLTRLNVPQLAWANAETLWPVMLVLGGGVMLWRALRS